jgi:hypothetical protein
MLPIHITETNLLIPAITLQIKAIYQMIKEYFIHLIQNPFKKIYEMQKIHKINQIQKIQINQLLQPLQKLLFHPFITTILLISTFFFILMLYDKFEYYWERHERLEHKIRMLERETERLRKKNELQEAKIRILHLAHSMK